MNYSIQTYQLTKLEAFKVMVKFLEDIYAKNQSDDIAVLLGVSALLQDDRPVDSALWKDWVNAIRHNDLRDTLTHLEAFSVMTKFLEDYYECGESKDVLAIIKQLKETPINPIVWDEWLACIHYITSDAGKSYGYFELY